MGQAQVNVLNHGISNCSKHPNFGLKASKSTFQSDSSYLRPGTLKHFGNAKVEPRGQAGGLSPAEITSHTRYSSRFTKRGSSKRIGVVLSRRAHGTRISRRVSHDWARVSAYVLQSYTVVSPSYCSHQLSASEKL